METINVLIVEDERLVAKDIQEMVETLGYRAYPPVATGEMAVETAVEKRPDLILMDIILAGAMNGVEAAAQIRARLQIPVIYLTAHADQGTLQRAKQTEPYGYILKPVEPRELAIGIEMALHKHAIEKKVRMSERRYRTLFSSSPDGLLLIDPAGRILMTNPVAAALFDSENGRGLENRLILDFFSPKDHGRAAAFILQKPESTSRESAEFVLRRVDQSSFPGEVRSAWILDEEERPQTALVVVRDTTQQRLLQERIRRAEQNNLLGRIAAGVAHEVRNPLNAIQSITEALFQELGPKAEYELYSQHIRSQVSRLSRLMKDLLHLGKPVQAENLQLVSLPEVCLAAANLWREANPKEPREISFEAAPGSASLRVRVDATILQQALLNLIENAVQHSPPAQPIFFSLGSPEQRMIPVRVIDRGSGIPAPNLERVFEPFFTTRKGGTGLGLSLVKQSIEAMGGSVGLRNNEPSPGCTAEVRLPIHDPCYETNNSLGG